MNIDYRFGNDLNIDQVIDLYKASTLGLRRPVDDKLRMQQMIREANLVVSAWAEDRLVGIARSLSDFCYATYLADLAVDSAYQKQGIGKELMRLTRQKGGRATVFLFAAPAAVDYYPHMGFREGKGFMLKEEDILKL